MKGDGRIHGRKSARGPWRWRSLVLIGLTVASVLAPSRDSQAWELLEGEGYGLRLGGYVQSAGGVVRPGLEGDATYGGLHAQALRLQWRASLGGDLMVEVDQRVVSRMTSGALMQGGEVYGLGSSVTPMRSGDWEWCMLEEPGVGVTHDIELLVLRYC